MADITWSDSISATWSAGDSIVGLSGGAFERWEIDAILGKSSTQRIPTKVHPGSNGIDSSGPVIVNPSNLSGVFPSGGDDLGVAGSGNRGAFLYTTGPSGLVTLYLGDNTNGAGAVQLQHSQVNNHFTIVRGTGRLRFEDGGIRIYDGTSYGSLMTRFQNWTSFTPILYGTTTGTGTEPTYATNGQYGRYKVENTTATFIARIEISAVGSVAGSIRIGDLPETAASNAVGADFPCAVGRINENSNAIDLGASVGQGSTHVELYRNQNSSSANSVNIVETNLGADFAITVMGSYPI